MSDRAALAARLAPLALLLGLAVALLARPAGPFRLASPAGGPADDVAAALDGLDRGALVLVGFDPDLGTYAEIRPTVRSLTADLLDRGARLALVSLTPEGRALALAEVARLRSAGVDAGRIVDLGFVPGAEAGLVALAAGLGDGEARGLAGAVAAPLGDERVALAVVVGGNDLGPRSWVEQVAPRVPGIDILAVAPTVLLPELRPYLGSGQLVALLGTPRDGAAYVDAADVDGLAGQLVEPPRSTAAAVALGLLAAAAWLGWLLLSRATAVIRSNVPGPG